MAQYRDNDLDVGPAWLWLTAVTLVAGVYALVGWSIYTAFFW